MNSRYVIRNCKYGKTARLIARLMPDWETDNLVNRQNTCISIHHNIEPEPAEILFFSILFTTLYTKGAAVHENNDVLSVPNPFLPTGWGLYLCVDNEVERE